MENTFQFIDLDLNQSRIYTDMCQVFEAWLLVEREYIGYKGGMFWKKSGKGEYLFRSSNSRGDGRSLGPRTPETESIYAAFHDRKQWLETRRTSLQLEIRKQAPYVKAARLNRTPRIVASLLREIHRQGWLGKQLVVVGTHALLAYESVANLHFETGLMSTLDLDLMWDVRKQLHLAGSLTRTGLLGLLKKADSSFEPLEPRSFCAVNLDGFRVDLIKPTERPPWKPAPEQMAPGDLFVASIPNMDWLLNAPKFSATVFDQDGFPLLLTCPDPRAYALHKSWLSKQPNRSPAKAKRDLAQAYAVARLVQSRLPHLPMKAELMRQFPLEISETLPDLPRGFE